MGNVEISTIDGFQGREKDIVIFTCVRAPGHGKNHSNQGGKIKWTCLFLYLNTVLFHHLLFHNYCIMLFPHYKNLARFLDMPLCLRYLSFLMTL